MFVQVRPNLCVSTKCMYICWYFKHIMQLVWLVVSFVVVSQMCPIEIEQCNYTTSRQDTNDAVIEMSSQLLWAPLLRKKVIENLYEIVSTGLGIYATSEGFVHF